MATIEAYCQNGNNKGVCSSNSDPNTGRTCVAKYCFESPDCYRTGEENVN